VRDEDAVVHRVDRELTRQPGEERRPDDSIGCAVDGEDLDRAVRVDPVRDPVDRHGGDAGRQADRIDDRQRRRVDHHHAEVVGDVDAADGLVDVDSPLAGLAGDRDSGDDRVRHAVHHRHFESRQTETVVLTDEDAVVHRVDGHRLGAQRHRNDRHDALRPCGRHRQTHLEQYRKDKDSLSHDGTPAVEARPARGGLARLAAAT
jgi:hypothetical protein